MDKLFLETEEKKEKYWRKAEAIQEQIADLIFINMVNANEWFEQYKNNKMTDTMAERTAYQRKNLERITTLEGKLEQLWEEIDDIEKEYAKEYSRTILEQARTR